MNLGKYDLNYKNEQKKDYLFTQIQLGNLFQLLRMRMGMILVTSPLICC